MEELFIRAFNVSITASFLVFAILIYRLFAKKSPKWVSVLLWGLVGIRLLFPFEIESEISLIPVKSTVPTTITQDRYPAIDTGFSGINELVNPVLSGSMEARPEYSANPMQIVVYVLGWIWLAVMTCMILYILGSSLYLRTKTRVRIEREERVYLCDYVRSPFILGIIRPSIYLPSDITDKDYEHVIAHERAHIKRGDHVVKPLGFLLLSVYWFNPFMWVAYLVLCRDIESACDEKVIAHFDEGKRAEYSEALLCAGLKGRAVGACPLAFGEVSVKSRVSAISRYERPTAGAIAISLLVCIMFTACFLTYKKNDPVSTRSGIWYAGKLIGAVDKNTDCDNVPRLVFTESGDVLVQTDSPDKILYTRLGKMNTAYISRDEYRRLFSGVGMREGYGADRFYETVKAAWRIDPLVSSGIDYEEVYLLRSEKELYMGYADGGRISAIYEMRFNEMLPTYLYTSQYTSADVIGAKLIFDTQNKVGRVVFTDTNYSPTGKYVYENSRIIFTSDDDFALKFVFIDVGGMLIYSEKESDIKGLSGFFPDGTSFSSSYSLYGAVSSAQFFDIDSDGKQELVTVSRGQGDTLWYLIHSSGETAVNKTVPFVRYDDLKLEVKDGALYLVCEYREVDFNSYRYLVTYNGEELIFTEVTK